MSTSDVAKMMKELKIMHDALKEDQKSNFFYIKFLIYFLYYLRK